MKNINKKESLAESDLEEGEIPEFEVGRNANSEDLNLKEHEKNQLINIHCGDAPHFGRMMDNPLVRISNPLQGCLKNNSVYFPSDKGRYELPFVEGDYVSEKSKSFIRNKVPQNSFYDYDIAERRLKYVHPFQATYGSVEHIMTKIGETLGRSNDFYCKGKRLTDPRNSIKLNNVGATFRESGSLFGRFRNKYRKKKRYSKSNSDSDREIWEVNGKLKRRDSLDMRRKEEKDFRKKRKAKCTNTNSNASETNKSIMLEKSGNDLSAESVKPIFGGNERLLKAIREIQERENGAMESHETPVPEDSSSTIPSFATTCLSEKDNEKPASCGAFNSDDNQETRNYEDLSEKSSVNGEDSDDDIELIKLRLLALTSNKRKNNVLEEEKINDALEKLDENSKSEFTDDEKTSTPDDMIARKSNQDNDIDRYELMLRAEALKTALLKKHKHMIRKRKYSSCSISMNVENEIENSEKLGNEIIVSDGTEIKTKEEEDSFSMENDVNMDVTVTTSVTKNGTVSESDTNLLRTFQLDNQVCANNLPSVDFSKGCALLDRKSSPVTEDVKRVNQTGKKLKRRRLRKNKKSGVLNLTEISKKENSGINSLSANESDKKIKAALPASTNQKKALKDHEKKFILVDSSQLSKSQSTLSSNLEQSDKNTVSAKSNGIINAASTAKIPETEIQRIIVHLGSDSSDDEAPPRPKSEAKSSEVPENVEPPCVTSGCAQSKILDYEKSVELLLKDARRRIEEKMETPQKIPPTPEAVYSHLAPSQRLEYIRLKQKIAETEKLRKMKENTSASQESVAKTQGLNAQSKRVAFPTSEIHKKELTTLNKTQFGIKSLSLKSNSSAIAGKNSNASSNNNKKCRNKNIVRVSVNEVNKSGTASAMNLQMERNIRLTDTVNDLGSKLSPKTGSSSNSVSVVKKILERKKTLTQNRLHLERLKVLWKNIKMEKMIEDKCLNELKRLKIQQNFFELKVSQQRTKIKKLAEESKQIYEAFQKMNKGLEMSGKKRKIFATERSSPEVVVDSKVTRTNVSEESFKSETVGHVDDIPTPPKTEEGNLVGKIDGKINLQDKDQEAVKSSDVALSGIAGKHLKEYNSPLQRHSTGSEPSSCQRVDPNTIMCQYDLTGRCNDEECPYQHLRG